MTTSFTETIKLMSSMAKAAVNTCLPSGTLEQCMLHYLVVKFVVENNLREVAKITAKYLSEFGHMGIQENTANVLKGVGLNRSKRYGVGYPHADGTFHYFEVKPAEPAEPVKTEEKYMDIEYAMERMDWTYAMSDDLRVWRAGEKTYKALVQKCKDAGMSEREAKDFQEKFFLSKGYTKPFTCMAIIHY